MNKLLLTGRLTAAPVMRTTTNGTAVLSFSVAVPRKYAAKGEERQVDFVNCVAWKNTAVFIERYFSKGDMIALEASLQSRKYTDVKGRKRTAWEAIVENAEFCGGYGSGGAAEAPGAEDPAADIAEDVDELLDDEDLPFN